MTQIDISVEPFRSVYIAMTEVIEEAVAAQERGDATEAARLCEEASVLGKAIGILARGGIAKPAAR